MDPWIMDHHYIIIHDPLHARAHACMEWIMDNDVMMIMCLRLEVHVASCADVTRLRMFDLDGGKGSQIIKCIRYSYSSEWSASMLAILRYIQWLKLLLSIHE